MRTHIAALAMISVLALACASPSVPGSAPVPSSALSGPSTSAPTDEPTPTLQPDQTFDWRPIGEPVAFRGASVRFVAVGSGFVAVGCVLGLEICDAPAIWTSLDGRDWSGPTELPLLPGELPGPATAAVAWQSGLVVAGHVGRGDRFHVALWFAPDGQTFERVPDDASFADASIVEVLELNGSLVAVGSGLQLHYSGFKAWRSEDGFTWTYTDEGATGEGATGDYVPSGAVGIEGGVVAWGACSICVPETAFWRSVDGITWTGARRELEGEFAHATALGVTHAGLVAFGTTGVDPTSPTAWSLPNGAGAWQADDPPPQPERTTITTHVLVGHGAVLAGTSHASDSQTGLIWLRGPDDVAWREPITAPGVSVVTLLQDPDRPADIILVGQVDRNGRQVLAVWSGSVDWAP
jgi:hypothetical protein